MKQFIIITVLLLGCGIAHAQKTGSFCDTFDCKTEDSFDFTNKVLERLSLSSLQIENVEELKETVIVSCGTVVLVNQIVSETQKLLDPKTPKSELNKWHIENINKSFAEGFTGSTQELAQLRIYQLNEKKERTIAKLNRIYTLLKK